MENQYRPCSDGKYQNIGHDRLDLHVHNSTRGHETAPEIREALLFWKTQWKKERNVKKDIQVIDAGTFINSFEAACDLNKFSGYNISVEAYSIFKSEVENFSDPHSGLNRKLLSSLNSGNTEVIFIISRLLCGYLCFRFMYAERHYLTS